MSQQSNNNPLICDPNEGVCGLPGSTQAPYGAKSATGNTLKLVYFTDPICSSCWGIEPQLRKLKLEYGKHITLEYRMGGLLPDWSYNSGGISKPSDVAHHWDEVSLHYDMPIDGDVWLEDPLSSSYPPSIAFKAAQLQDETKAIHFLRTMREMVFLQKKNIARPEHIATAATRAGLDTTQLKANTEGTAKLMFEEDLKLARQYGVMGFPTMFIINERGSRQMVYGTKPYAVYEAAVLRSEEAAVKVNYDSSPEALFAHYPSLTAKEYAELSGTPREQSEAALDAMVAEGKLSKLTTILERSQETQQCVRTSY
ncbi:MAG: DsbA family protein [Sphingobacteriales bacterium]|nr:MAG: DsbA family protein [Sphingobacteriales bacterium]